MEIYVKISLITILSYTSILPLSHLQTAIDDVTN